MADYLSNMLAGISRGYVESMRAKQEEERTIRLQTKMSEMQFENERKMRQLAIEETAKAEEEKREREIQGYKKLGVSVQKHADLLGDSPEQVQRSLAIGKLMEEEGISPEVANIIYKTKATGTGEFAEERLKLQQEKLQFEQEKFKQLQEFKKDLQNKKAPSEVIKAQEAYNRSIAAMRSEMAKPKRRGVTKEQTMLEYSEQINNSAATVERWREEAELPPLGLATIEEEDTPAAWYQKLFGTETVKKPVLKGKKIEAKKETPIKPTKDWKTRIDEIKKENPKITPKEIAAKLKNEGIEIK